jgi:hypothetical protein
VCRCLWLRLERPHDHLLDLIISHGSLVPRPWLVEEAIQPRLNEATAPLTDSLARESELLCHCFVGLSCRALDHDLGSGGELLRNRATPNEALKSSALLFG